MEKQVKKTNPEAEEFNRLKDLEFEFLSPQDEYSDQPDSGSRANGIAAKQEYGIDVSKDAKATRGVEASSNSKVIPGASQYSQDHRHAEEVEKNLK